MECLSLPWPNTCHHLILKNCRKASTGATPFLQGFLLSTHKSPTGAGSTSPRRVSFVAFTVLPHAYTFLNLRTQPLQHTVYIIEYCLDSTSCSSNCRESTHSVGDPDLIPGSGRSSGEGSGSPLQYSCLENPMERGAWRATVRGAAEQPTLLTVHHSTQPLWYTFTEISPQLQLCKLETATTSPGPLHGLHASRMASHCRPSTSLSEDP